MAIILKHEKVERGNQPIRGVSRNQINLLFFERPREQPKIHDARRLRKAQPVRRREPLVSIRTLHELVPETGPPLWRIGGRLRNRLQFQPARILAANHNGKRIVEPKWRSEPQIEAPRVFRLHPIVHSLARTLRSLLQNRSDCRARVFRIDIDSPRQNRLLANKSARQVKAAFDVQAGLRFQPLRKNLAQDCLLREVFRANHDLAFPRRAARREL